jgi:hypothetical protein
VLRLGLVVDGEDDDELGITIVGDGLDDLRTKREPGRDVSVRCFHRRFHGSSNPTVNPGDCPRFDFRRSALAAGISPLSLDPYDVVVGAKLRGPQYSLSMDAVVPLDRNHVRLLSCRWVLGNLVT